MISGSLGLSGEERNRRALLDEANARDLISRGTAAFMQDWALSPMIRTQGERMTNEEHARMISRRSSGDALSIAAALRGFGQGSMPLASSRLKELSMPVLIVCGQEDAKYRSIAWEMFAKIEKCISMKMKTFLLSRSEDWVPRGVQSTSHWSGQIISFTQ